MAQPIPTSLVLQQITLYKKRIDDDIATYSEQMRASTKDRFGEQSLVAVNAYLDLLSRGGKRTRGILTMLGYEMLGGDNQAIIIRAARSIEMMHAYLLILDDINDRSLTRRGAKAVHIQLADYHREHKLTGNPDHFGESIAINAALIGAHNAQMIMGDLGSPPELLDKALNILNHSMLVTGHGQVNDVFNSVREGVTEHDIENVMEWKTAYYSVLNPLHTGMVLADASCEDTNIITPYAIATGKAFQILNDINGMFGSEFKDDEAAMDDLKEGKRTLLIAYALEQASAEGRQFLLDQLGNSKLTEGDFEKAKRIIEKCGALEYAKSTARRYKNEALDVLSAETSRWQPRPTNLLRDLTEYLLYTPPPDSLQNQN